MTNERTYRCQRIKGSINPYTISSSALKNGAILSSTTLASFIYICLRGPESHNSTIYRYYLPTDVALFIGNSNQAITYL